MASRHQGRHKPRHHTHAVKSAHINRIPLPPLAPQTPAVDSLAASSGQAAETPPNETGTVSAEPIAAE